jgi:hypothetical protein
MTSATAINTGVGARTVNRGLTTSGRPINEKNRRKGRHVPRRAANPRGPRRNAAGRGVGGGICPGGVVGRRGRGGARAGHRRARTAAVARLATGNAAWTIDATVGRRGVCVARLGARLGRLGRRGAGRAGCATAATIGRGRALPRRRFRRLIIRFGGAGRAGWASAAGTNRKRWCGRRRVRRTNRASRLDTG